MLQKNTLGYTTDDELISMVHKKPIQLNHKKPTKTNNRSENGQRCYIDINRRNIGIFWFLVTKIIISN